MNLQPIRRHSALAVLRVKEAESYDLDDGVAWHRAKRLSSLFKHTRETCVSDHAARVRYLRDNSRRIDFKITNDQVDVGVVALRERRDKSRAQDEGLELDAGDSAPLRKPSLRARDCGQFRDRNGDGNRIDLRRIIIGPDLHRPSLHTTRRLGSDHTRPQNNRAQERPEECCIHFTRARQRRSRLREASGDRSVPT